MLATLKPGGFCIFTMSKKHLSEDSIFNMGYTKAIKTLIDRNLWKPVIHREFLKYHGVSEMGKAQREEPYSFFVFQKQ